MGMVLGAVVTSVLLTSVGTLSDHNVRETQCRLVLESGLDEGNARGLQLRHTEEPMRWVSLLWRASTLKVTPADEAPSQQELLDTAREMLGTPYVWGGVGGRGLDCSGFTNLVYARHGYDLPRVSRDQYRVGIKTPRSELSAGDLLFFVSEPGQSRITHVGMYIGDNEFIHAASGKGKVTYDRLTSRYYNARYVGARRLLSLPPSRFSNGWGGAAKGKLYEWTGSSGGVDPVLLEVGLADPVLSEIGLTQAGDVLSEHQAGDRPIQLASGFLKGTIGSVGPSATATEETALGVRLGLGSMNERFSMVVVPEFTFFGHKTALEVNIGVPLVVPTDGGEGAEASFSAGWDEATDYSKIIQGIRFGQKEANLYLELSRTLSGTQGHGQLMRFFTPNIATRHLPSYVIEPNALSFAFDGYLDFGGFEIFIDDVISPDIVGMLTFVRPGVLAGSSNKYLRRLSTSLNYVTDTKAPYERDEAGDLMRRAVHGVGSSTEFKFYKSDSLDLKLYGDVSGIFAEGISGAGGAFGFLIRTNIAGGRTHVFRSRLELRASSPTFIPSYFDTTYSLGRFRAPVDQPSEQGLTKLKLLDELQGTPSRYGFYGELTYQLHRKLSLALSYEDGGTFGELPPSERFSGRNIMAVLKLQDMYLPRSSKAIDVYVAYHLRNVNEFSGLLTLERPNEYIFASLSYRASRFLELTASLRKGVNESVNAENAVVDAMLGAAFRYEL
ncbi:MAG: C40 family peptidase [Myxococcota bacterium]|nr:C40 family peptidase [Myxococcota bacterium]